MSQLVIGTKKYRMDEALSRPSLNDLYLLKIETGLGMKSIKNGLNRFESLGEDIEAISEDLEVLNTIRAVVWLVRRLNGEKLSIDQANDFPLDDLSFEADPEEETAAADPTNPPTDSGPAAGGDGDLPATTPRSTSRTSA